MSDDAAKHFEADKPEPVPDQSKAINLLVTRHPNGKVDVTGPLADRVLAFGMLAAAQHELTRFYLVQEAEQAKASRGGVNGLLKRMNGG